MRRAIGWVLPWIVGGVAGCGGEAGPGITGVDATTPWEAAGDDADPACPGGLGCACEADADCASGFCATAGDGRWCAADCEADEACNGLDDDCDGLTDEDLSRPCEVSTADGTCAGVETCAAGRWEGCDAGTPAAETCNGADDDCDGTVDEGCACEPAATDACYGGPAGTMGVGACAAGRMTCGADGTWGACQDDVRPAVETCNGVDDDCDGQTDEDVGTTWHRDADGDGYGASGATVQACSQPAGYAATATDCDDASAARNPGAAETCGNQVDDDCDGSTDEGCGELAKFSFFVTSMAGLIQLSGNPAGFGGDLRFGETGAGAGLRGADKICATLAEASMAGASAKTWRAFLSVKDDGTGKQVNAIDRIGEGPWYDRMGRLFANSRSELFYDRPQNANNAIKNDFPNEWGVLNHQPDPTQPKVDNHDMLTGSNTSGTLYSSTATCLDWTSAKGNTTTEGRPRVGHSWPTGGMCGGGGGGGGGGGNTMCNWMSALTENGCAPGINLVDNGAGDPTQKTVGAGGGYGGFYCFALTP